MVPACQRKIGRTSERYHLHRLRVFFFSSTKGTCVCVCVCVCVCACSFFEAFVTNTAFASYSYLYYKQSTGSVFFHSQPVYTLSKSWKASIENRSRSIRGTKDRIFRNANLIETRVVSFHRLYLRFRHRHHVLVHKHDS